MGVSLFTPWAYVGAVHFYLKPQSAQFRHIQGE